MFTTIFDTRINEEIKFETIPHKYHTFCNINGKLSLQCTSNAKELDVHIGIRCKALHNNMLIVNGTILETNNNELNKFK